jgi:hypothetical protein
LNLPSGCTARRLPVGGHLPRPSRRLLSSLLFDRLDGIALNNNLAALRLITPSARRKRLQRRGGA